MRKNLSYLMVSIGLSFILNGCAPEKQVVESKPGTIEVSETETTTSKSETASKLKDNIKEDWMKFGKNGEINTNAASDLAVDFSSGGMLVMKPSYFKGDEYFCYIYIMNSIDSKHYEGEQSLKECALKVNSNETEWWNAFLSDTVGLGASYENVTAIIADKEEEVKINGETFYRIEGSIDSQPTTSMGFEASGKYVIYYRMNEDNLSAFVVGTTEGYEDRFDDVRTIADKIIQTYKNKE